MFKITLLFKSNVPGVFTKEEETATDKQQADIKYDRMLNKWFDILCPHINFNRFSDLVQLHRLGCMLDGDNRVKFEKWRNKRNTFKINLIDEMLDTMDSFDEDVEGKETTSETQRKFKITMEEI